jgi:hypothetical protein
MVHKHNPFSYKINYEKALAEDAKMIELYANDGPVARLTAAYEASGITADTFPGWKPLHAYDALLVVAGLSMQAFDAFVTTYKMNRKDGLAVIRSFDSLGAASKFVKELVIEAAACWPSIGAAYTQGKPIEDHLANVPFLTEEVRNRLLKKAEANRSRHSRNKSKHG